MDFMDALLTFFRALFSALTKFLGQSIPFISDMEGILVDDATAADGEG
ncbi:MAG: hypothetical protein IJS90_05140 [Clostridia bacterium]|nr:hypothetical protein [Clostridia bacterium]